MLSEAHKAECSIHGQRAEGEGITFSVSGGTSTAGTSDGAATEPFPQQPKHPEQPNIHPSTVPPLQQPKQPATATVPSPQQPKQPAVEVGQNNGNDQSNGRGEDSGSKVNDTELKSPRSLSFAHVNLTRRPGTLEDGPSFGLFEPGSDDDLLFQEFPQVRTPTVKTSVADLDSFLSIRTRSHLFGESPANSAGPVYDVTPIATRPPISTGPAGYSTHLPQLLVLQPMFCFVYRNLALPCSKPLFFLILFLFSFSFSIVGQKQE